MVGESAKRSSAELSEQYVELPAASRDDWVDGDLPLSELSQLDLAYAPGGLGDTLDAEFKSKLRRLTDNCSFNTLTSITLTGSWVSSEYSTLLGDLGALSDESDRDYQLALLSRSDAIADDPIEYK